MKSDEISIGFLTYLSRSGSTFLSRTLNDYKEICVTLEASLPAELFGIKGYKIPIFNDINGLNSFVDNLFEFSKLNTWPIDKKDLMAELEDLEFPIDGKNVFKGLLLCYKNLIKPEATTIIFKGSPIMPWFTSELRKHYPDSIIIHVFRDPRAVYASQKKNVQPYSQKVFTNSPIETAYDWKRAIQTVKKLSGRNTVEVKYEDLLTAKEKVIYTCFEKLGISKEKANDNMFSELIPDEEREIHKKVIQNPDQSRIDGWKREVDRREIELLEYYLNRDLIEKDYYLVTDNVNKAYSTILTVKKDLILIFIRRGWARLSRIFSYLVKEPSYFFKKLNLLK